MRSGGVCDESGFGGIHTEGVIPQAAGTAYTLPRNRRAVATKPDGCREKIGL